MKSPHFIVLVLLGVVFSGLSLYLDVQTIQLVQTLSMPVLDSFFITITNMSVVLFCLLFIPLLYLAHKRKYRALVTLSTAFMLSLATSVLMKLIFVRERPTLTELVFDPLFRYSFPSTHAMVSVCLATVLFGLLPRLKWVWVSAAVLICVSRVYLEVHYLSDVVAGSFLGLLLGLVLRHPHLRSPLTHTPTFEVKRKLAHIGFGLSLVAILHYELFSFHFVFPFLLFILGCSFWCRTKSLWGFDWLLQHFERKICRKNFPFRGMFFFGLGAYFIFLLIPEKDILIASILILTFGDSLSHLYGAHFGSTPHPLNNRKALEGLFMGFAGGFLSALLFVPITLAFWGALIAMFIESLEVKWGEILIDDNLTVITTAAVVMYGIRILF